MPSDVPVFSDLSLSDAWFLAEAALRTLSITVVAVIFGTLLGVFIGWPWSLLGRWSGAVVASVLDVFRSVPLIIQLVLFDSFVAIWGFPMNAFQSGSIVLTLYTGALVAFLTKGGIDSVHRETRRAARSLGMNGVQEFFYVVVPIGIRAVFPSWIGIAIALLKDSSLVSVLGYVELIRASQILTTRTQEPFLLLAIVGSLYFALSYPISRIGAQLERRWKYD